MAIKVVLIVIEYRKFVYVQHYCEMYMYSLQAHDCLLYTVLASKVALYKFRLCGPIFELCTLL